MRLVAIYEVGENVLGNYAGCLELTPQVAAFNYLNHHLPAGSPFFLQSVEREKDCHISATGIEFVVKNDNGEGLIRLEIRD